MGDVTLRQALEEYEKIYLAARNLASRTRVEYLNDLEDLIKFLKQLGIKDVQDIRFPYLERYLAELDHRGIAGSTRKRKVVSIRSFLWYLYQDRYLATNLAKRLIPPLAEPKSPSYLTKSEYERLLKVASNKPRDFAVIQLLLQTGIKLSELTQLTTDDIEPPSELTSEMKDAGHLHIRGGTRRNGRVIPLNHDTCIALDTYLRKRLSTTTPALFLNRFGRQLGDRGVEKIVAKYLKQAEIGYANVQSLRHTFAIRQLAKGIEADALQKTMGYEDPRSMERYVHIAQKNDLKPISTQFDIS